ncbi:hypothetical protein [Nonomuraea sp. SYSU D8015]|uniref:hypothetical protein n=1 Tax=Nonomuraea sp. SYSU D8015 TaxID=2593644 RepID=UPI0016616717|nr:hypothetical protein [Nonomuraea sp. SYSU D8015]
MEHPGRPLWSALPADEDRARLYELPYIEREVTVRGVTKTIKFWEIAALAEMLNRKPSVIRLWRSNGTLPRSPFWQNIATTATGSKHGIRYYYSEDMMLGIVRIAREEGVLERYNVQITRTAFTRRVQALFDAAQAALAQKVAA